jgi:hypothetical protein
VDLCRELLLIKWMVGHDEVAALRRLGHGPSLSNRCPRVQRRRGR